LLIVLSHGGRPTRFRSSSVLCSCCKDSSTIACGQQGLPAVRGSFGYLKRWAVEEVKLGGSSDRLIGEAFDQVGEADGLAEHHVESHPDAIESRRGRERGVSEVESRWRANRLESPNSLFGLSSVVIEHSLSPSVRQCHLLRNNFLAFTSVSPSRPAHLPLP
jgi:hypothetical protein